MVTNHGSLFCSIHAAGSGTITLAMFWITGTNAFYHNYSFGLFVVRRTHDMTLGRTGCIYQTFKMQTGNDIFIFAVAIFPIYAVVKLFIAGSHYNGTIFFRYQFIYLFIINSTCRTEFGANPAYIFAIFSAFKFQAVYTVNNRFIRNCLWEWRIDCCTFAQIHIKFIVCFSWTFGHAGTTSSTFLHINRPCFFPNGHFKVSYITIYMF